MCQVTVINYDMDWSFRNKVTKQQFQEGNTLEFVGETPKEALKAFTNIYSVEGYNFFFGKAVPNGYGHVVRVRSLLKNYVRSISRGTVKDLYIMGNWNVSIKLIAIKEQGIS